MEDTSKARPPLTLSLPSAGIHVKREECSTFRASNDASIMAQQKAAATPPVVTSAGAIQPKQEASSIGARQDIWNLLQQAESPGSFATAGTCPDMVMPGLVVDGVGQVGLPLSDYTLSELCTKYPDITSLHGGLGNEAFTFQSPRWNTWLKGIVRQVCDTELGIDRDFQMKSHSPKLVLIRDGEESPPLSFTAEGANQNQVATLIVTFPSVFQGGHFVVECAGRKHTFPQDKDPYATQYVAFFNKCRFETKPTVSGNRLCVVYRLIRTAKYETESPVPCGNRFGLVDRLREAATRWDENFDGHKLVIAKSHLRNKFSYKLERAMPDLLELAKEEGVALDWALGTVKYRIYGHGCGASHIGYDWTGIEKTVISLTLDDYRYSGRIDDYGDYESEKYGDNSDDDESEDDTASEADDSEGEYDVLYDGLTVDVENEMVPPNFYAQQKPHETFKSTYHGVKAKRIYDNEEVIVVWPRSWSWQVLAGDQIEKMCAFLVLEPDAQNASLLSSKVLAKQYSCYGTDRSSDISSFMEVLVAVKDEDLALGFWKQYLSKQRAERRIPKEILHHLKSFVDCFGSNPEILSSLQEAIPNDAIAMLRDESVDFVCACVKALVVDFSPLCRQMVEQLVHLLNQSSVTPLSRKSIVGFLKLFATENELSKHGASLLSSFLESASQGLTSTGYYEFSDNLIRRATKKTGSIFCDAGLAAACNTLRWDIAEDSLVKLLNRHLEVGLISSTVELVLELIGAECNLDSSICCKKSAICSKLTQHILDSAIADAIKEPTPKRFIDLFRLVQTSRVPATDSIVAAMIDMNLDDSIISSVAIEMSKQDSPSSQQKAAISKMSQYCVDKILSRLSIPLGMGTDWSSDVTVNTAIKKDREIDGQKINKFFRSPCKEILKFQLAVPYHNQMLVDLRQLVDAGYIQAFPSRPSGTGRWDFVIRKLKNQCKPLESFATLSACTCWPSDAESRKCVIANCHKKQKKRQSDESTLNKLLSLLSSDEAKGTKRKLSTADSHMAVGHANSSGREACSEKQARVKSSDEVIDLSHL